MKFQVDHYSENGMSLVRLHDREEKTVVSILPGTGALLHSFSVPINNSSYNIIDNYHNRETLERELALSFKSAKLSPFACRIPHGKYTFKGVEYEIEHKFNDGSAIHGLLFNKPFEVVEEIAEDNFCSVLLEYRYNRDDQGFPFPYTCEVRYILRHQNMLQLETSVTNVGDKAMPIADGWHPYFKLGQKINDWWLQFSSDTILEFNENLIPTGKYLPDSRFIRSRQMGETVLDNCFLLKVDELSPCCILENPANGLRLSFYTNVEYPYLQLYTPPDRCSIAIENLSAAPDCFNNGIGLLTLQAGKFQTFNIGYQVTVQ